MAQEGIAAALTIPDDIMSRLEQAQKMVERMSASAEKLGAGFKTAAEGIRSAMQSLGKNSVDASFKPTGMIENFRIISETAAKAEQVTTSMARKTISTEEELNRRLKTILNKRAFTREQITQRLIDLEKYQEQWNVANNASIANKKGPLDAAQYQAAARYAEELRQRLAALDMEYSKVRTSQSQNAALGMPENTYQQAIAKLKALKQARMEAMKPGGESAANAAANTNAVAALDNMIERLTAKLPALREQMQQEKRAAKELARETEKMAKLRDKISTKQAEASSILGLKEGSVDALRTKLEALKRKVEEVKRVSGKNVDASFIATMSKETTKLETKLWAAERAAGMTARSASMLAGMFRTAFSFALVANFARKLVQIRGEFELAEKSIGIIVGNANMGREIFNEIQKIAIQSPFQIKDLVKQTRQLAAYRIETDKLIDTTKMLGDISAGLGVDMNRLILAFGQVKAATVLKGTELRQFSEAGVNMLGGLADRFSELQGRMVTTGEVLSMISKRMVSFEDVNAVLQEQTAAGGTFYRMQEKQALTLQGRISNLADRVDIMFNKIGQKSQGFLNTVVDVMQGIVSHYKVLEPILVASFTGVVVTAFVGGLMKIGVALKNTMALFALFRTEGIIKTIASLGAWAPAIGVVIASITALAIVWRNATKANRELKRAAKESVEQMNSDLNDYNRFIDTMNNSRKSIEERNKAFEDLKGQFGKIIPLENENVGSIQRGTEKYYEYANAIREANAELARERQLIVLRENMMDGTDKTAKRLEKTLSSAAFHIKQGFGEEVASLFDPDEITNSALMETLDRMWDGQFENASQAASSFFKQLDQYYGQAEGHTEEMIRKTYEFQSVLDRFSKIWQKYNIGLGEGIPGNRAFGQGGQEFGEEIKNLGKTFDSIKSKLRIEFPDLESSDVALFHKKADDEMREVVDGLRKRIQESDLGESFKNNLISSLDKGANKLLLSPLHAELNDIFTQINQQFPALKKRQFGAGDLQLNAGEGVEAFIKRMQNLQKDAENAVKAWKDIGDPTERAARALEESIGYTKDEAEAMVSAIGALLPMVEKFAKTIADRAAASAYKSNLSSLVSEVKKAAKEFDKLDEEGDRLFRSKLDYLAGRVNVLLPKAYDSDTVKEWVKTLKGKLSEADINDILLSVNENDTADWIKKLSKQASDLWDRYDNAKKLEGWGLGFSGQSSTAILADLSEVERQLREKNTEESIDAANQIAEKRLQIARTEQEEAAKIMYEAQKKALTKTEQAYQSMYEDVRKIQENANKGDSGITEDQIKASVTARIAKGMKEVAEAQWEAYKSTQSYAIAFGNLEGLGTHALKALEKQLQGFIASGGLNATDMRSAMAALEKIQAKAESLANKTNFVSAFKKAFSDSSSAADIRTNILPELEDAYASSVEYTNMWRARVKELQDEQKEKGISAKNTQELANANNMLTEAERREANALARLNARREEANAKESAAEKTIKDITAAYDAVGSEISKTISLVKEVAEAFGGELDEETVAALDGFATGFSLVGSAIAVASGAMTVYNTLQANGIVLGTTLMATMWPLLAIGAALGAVVAIMKAKDAALTKQVEEHKDAVEALKDEYEELERAMKRAINLQSAAASNKQMLSNLEEQRRHLEDALAIEKSRTKQNDEVKDNIKGLEDDIRGVTASIDDAKDEWIEFMGGFSGSRDEAKSWVSAWLDAFKNAENGVSALGDSFDEMYDKLVEAQLADILMPELEKLKGLVRDAVADGVITEVEAAAIQAERSALQGLDAELREGARRFGVGVNGSTQTDTLQRGIEAVTEQTAQALESILNSTRYYVADNNRILVQWDQQLMNQENENSIVANIRSQTQYLRILSQIANAVFSPGSSGQGAGGLKVFVMG